MDLWRGLGQEEQEKGQFNSPGEKTEDLTKTQSVNSVGVMSAGLERLDVMNLRENEKSRHCPGPLYPQIAVIPRIRMSHTFILKYSVPS